MALSNEAAQRKCIALAIPSKCIVLAIHNIALAIHSIALALMHISKDIWAIHNSVAIDILGIHRSKL